MGAALTIRGTTPVCLRLEKSNWTVAACVAKAVATLATLSSRTNLIQAEGVEGEQRSRGLFRREGVLPCRSKDAGDRDDSAVAVPYPWTIVVVVSICAMGWSQAFMILTRGRRWLNSPSGTGRPSKETLRRAR